MTRLLLSSTAAVLLLAAPVVASAATRQVAPHGSPIHHAAAMTHHAAKSTGKHAKMAAGSHDSGSAAVNTLNDQSLARARAGQ